MKYDYLKKMIEEHNKKEYTNISRLGCFRCGIQVETKENRLYEKKLPDGWTHHWNGETAYALCGKCNKIGVKNENHLHLLY